MGSGFRTFTAGEVLTASNVQNYLMDQSVMVFGGSAARSSAIGTANFEEGMVSYLTDTDKVEAYNGTNWVSVAPTSSQGLTFINTTTVGSSVASFSLPNDTFSTTYDSYRVIFDGSTMTSAPSAAWRFRFRASGTDNSTASSYNFTGWNATPSSLSLSNDSSTWGFVGSTLDATPDRFAFIMDISGVALAKETKFMVWNVGMDGGTRRNINVHGFHSVQTAYDSMSFIFDSGTISGGKIKVYGYNN